MAPHRTGGQAQFVRSSVALNEPDGEALGSGAFIRGSRTSTGTYCCRISRNGVHVRAHLRAAISGLNRSYSPALGNELAH